MFNKINFLKKIKFFNIIIIYSFIENNNINILKKFFKKNFFNFLKEKNFFFKNFLKNSDIILINFKKKYKNNIKSFKFIKKLEFFYKKKPVYLKYKIIIINLKNFLDKNLYDFLIVIIKKKISYLKFLIITNNDLLLNLNLNSLNIFIKNKKCTFFIKVKNLYYFLNKSLFLTKKWIKNKNYKIYYWFVKNILNNFKNFDEKKKFLKIKILIKLFEKFIYDLLMVFMDIKPRFFLKLKKILKIMIFRIKLKKVFSLYKKINFLKKKKLDKKKNKIFFKKFFLEYKSMFIKKWKL